MRGYGLQRSLGVWMTVLGAVALLLPTATAHAARLQYVSDLISNSAPDGLTQHTLQFTLVNAVPPSGKIVISAENGGYVIPTGFNFLDVDFAVATSVNGTYVDRPLWLTPTASEDGVSVTTGSSGTITITLNSTTGLNAGDAIRIELGTHATFGSTGDSLIRNSSSADSYRIRIRTRNASNVQIDEGTAMIAVVQPVTTGLILIATAPVRGFGLPSGTIAANNDEIEISLSTNEIASCRFATTSGVLYDDMVNTFTSVSGILHYTVVTGHQNDTTYTYYVRCADIYNTQNDDDFLITFTLKETPSSNSSIQDPGGGNPAIPPNNFPPPGVTGQIGNGGSGDYAEGSSYLYRANVNFSGWTSPMSTIYVLKAGIEQTTAVSRGDGSFVASVDALERGTYTFSMYAVDRAGRRSATQSSTITLGQGTNNTISDLLLPPSIELSEASVALTGTVTISGESTPGSIIEVRIAPQTGATTANTKTYETTASKDLGTVPDGRWEVEVNARDLARGTYIVRARTKLSNIRQSVWSGAAFLGVGESATPNFGLRADINRDGKVNLVDFSIMLSFWGTSNADADINADGNINLSDFSIMLFNWTG